jgi:hypothetical protein
MKPNPQIYARAGGVLYLVLIAIGFYGEIAMQGRLVVSGNAAATAANIVAAEHLWRVGIVCDLVMHVLDVPLMLILYVLLKPVSTFLAQLGLLFTLVQTAVLVAFELTLLMPLFLVTRPAFVHAFEPAQRAALTSIFIDGQAYGFSIGLVFFGCACLIEGWLIWRSSYLPRPLGAFMVVAGVCYLVNTFVLLLAPAVAGALFPSVLLPAFVAELLLALWLLVKGVDAAKWRARAESEALTAF